MGRPLRPSVMSCSVDSLTLTFAPQCGYTIRPPKWTYRLALGLIESWPNLLQVVEFAQRRVGYGDTNSGFGLEYPTRPEKAGQLRFWRWTWRNNGRVKTRKYHFPEADYLAVLLALLLQRGEHAQAHALESQGPLPEVHLEPVSDPYDLSNYRFHGDFTYDAKQCLRLILDQRDFALATARAVAREGFSVADGSRLTYLDNRLIRLFLQRGHTQDVSEALYLSLLEQLHAKIFDRSALES